MRVRQNRKTEFSFLIKSNFPENNLINIHKL